MNSSLLHEHQIFYMPAIHLIPTPLLSGLLMGTLHPALVLNVGFGHESSDVELSIAGLILLLQYRS